MAKLLTSGGARAIDKLFSSEQADRSLHLDREQESKTRRALEALRSSLR